MVVFIGHQRPQLIEQVTEGEEARFRATLKRGMKILDERFAAESEQAAFLPRCLSASDMLECERQRILT